MRPRPPRPWKRLRACSAAGGAGRSRLKPLTRLASGYTYPGRRLRGAGRAAVGSQLRAGRAVCTPQGAPLRLLPRGRSAAPRERARVAGPATARRGQADKLRSYHFPIKGHVVISPGRLVRKPQIIRTGCGPFNFSFPLALPRLSIRKIKTPVFFFFLWEKLSNTATKAQEFWVYIHHHGGVRSSKLSKKQTTTKTNLDLKAA